MSSIAAGEQSDERGSHIWERVQTALTVLCGIFLVPTLIQDWASVKIHPSLPFISVACGAYFALGAGWRAIQRREVDVNILMVLAAIGAIVVGHAADAAVLLFLFSLSSTLETLAMSRTRSAIEGLIRLRPDEAILITPSGDKPVRTESLKVGDEVRVLAFQQVPVDGTVTSGQSSIDESAMTGESVPVAKAQGANVLAGTQNLDGMITVRVTAESHESTLEKIVRLVGEAQEHKASGERISSWFGQRYTFLVLAAFGLSFLVRTTMGETTQAAFYSALILLVAMSPCALVISTPASTLSALAWAAQNSILVRGGQYIESSGQVTTVAFDKTGTLTVGQPRLVEICVCQSMPAGVGGGPAGLCEDESACWHAGKQISAAALDVLGIGAAAEQYSTHPIADAIVTAARENGVDVPEADEHVAHSGLGVTAVVHGKRVKVGQRRFFEQGDERLPSDFVPHVESLQCRGMTVTVLQWEDRYAALGLRDTIRPEAVSAIRQLASIGIKRIVMLTGDTAQTATAVGQELGITEINPGLMPHDKARIIGEWTANKETVMMIGDGINDAPALAAASVGLAMGGLGSDIALRAADVVLVQDRVDRISDLILLGRKTNGVIRANLVFASSVVALLTIGSFLWSLPLPLAVVGHEGSTVLVILNGLRLLRGPSRYQAQSAALA